MLIPSFILLLQKWSSVTKSTSILTRTHAQTLAPTRSNPDRELENFKHSDATSHARDKTLNKLINRTFVKNT